MLLKSIQCSSLSIPFHASFKHASAERAATETFWVEVLSRDGFSGFGEGCPRAYVTAETLESARQFFSSHAREWLNAIHDIQTLGRWVSEHHSEIDRNPSAWAAVELALLDVFAQQRAESVEALLRLPELAGQFFYTAVLGDSPPRQFEAQLNHYLQAGFSTFKIKLSGDETSDLAKVKALKTANIPPRGVRADANNLWNDVNAAIHHLKVLDFPFFAIEEPLSAGDYQGMSHIASVIGTKIILDESLLRIDQLENISYMPERWIINLRVSKMGGLLRSINLVQEARRRRLHIIVGAHVGETSMLTRAGLTIANSAGDALYAQEGAFGTHLLASDVIDHPITFGKGGVLDSASMAIGSIGFGLAIPQPIPHSTTIMTASLN